MTTEQTALKAQFFFHPATVDQARAVISVALIALAPTGLISPVSLVRLRSVLGDAPAVVLLDPPATDEIIALTLRALGSRGPERVLGDLRGLMPPGLAETALVLALRAATFAGHLDRHAAAILASLAPRLGVPDLAFAEMKSVVAMLERPPV